MSDITCLDSTILTAILSSDLIRYENFKLNTRRTYSRIFSDLMRIISIAFISDLGRFSIRIRIIRAGWKLSRVVCFVE
ncbi:MAG: hypothetical protein QXE32_05285 [Sulfolobales archaeon]